jgi:hypothetical protein
MATLQEIVYGYKDYRRSGLQSQSESLDDRLVAFSVHYYRAKLLKESLQKNNLISSQFFSTLGNLQLVKADLNEACTIVDCTYRTPDLPQILTYNGLEQYTYVGSSDGLNPYSKITFNRLAYEKFAKYTANVPKWYQYGSYIYVINRPTPATIYVSIRGLFTNPTEVEKFKAANCPDNNQCTDPESMEYNYPLPDDMIDTIYKLMIDAENRFGQLTPQDTLNDSADSVVTNRQ